MGFILQTGCTVACSALKTNTCDESSLYSWVNHINIKDAHDLSQCRIRYKSACETSPVCRHVAPTPELSLLCSASQKWFCLFAHMLCGCWALFLDVRWIILLYDWAIGHTINLHTWMSDDNLNYVVYLQLSDISYTISRAPSLTHTAAVTHQPDWRLLAAELRHKK